MAKASAKAPRAKKKKTTKKAKKKPATILPFNKYLYYENSVQAPAEQIHIFQRVFNEVRGREPLVLREDFCGTFLISCEWVKSHPQRTAIGIDLDSEPLSYGKEHGFKALGTDEQSRIKLLQENVCVTRQPADIVAACNFSFFIFKEREQLKKYFKAVHESLNRDGVLILEMAGGPGFVEPVNEHHTYTVKGLGRYTYYWDQKDFDPINDHGNYSIHFKTADKKMHRDCFTYDWRVWNIPELRELLLEAGYREVAVYWEASDKKGEGTGEYVRMQKGDNAYSWIAFVVGIK